MAEDVRNPMLQFRVSPDLYDRLVRVADMYGVTKNDIARMAIGQYCGQVTGAIDAMSERIVGKTPDIEKMVEVMVPRFIEGMKAVEQK